MICKVSIQKQLGKEGDFASFKSFFTKMKIDDDNGPWKREGELKQELWNRKHAFFGSITL